MNQLSNRYYKLPVVAIIFSATFIACNRDELYNESPGGSLVVSSSNSTTLNENSNTAASHIAASEKLMIPAAVDVPANLPSGNSRVATYYAVGVQKYKAREKAGSNPVTYEWAFVAPLATLYDETNNKVGIHGAGPFWQQSSMDIIFAQPFTPAKAAPSPDPESIDWLLLMPKTGTTPTGIFRDVDYIQRIATKGGKAPTTPPTNINETVEVKYKAVYRFTMKNP